MKRFDHHDAEDDENDNLLSLWDHRSDRLPLGTVLRVIDGQHVGTFVKFG
jgi:hypothetical protein